MGLYTQTTDIRQLFNTIASKYDLANLLISFGCVSHWHRVLIQTVLTTHPPGTLLDLCCGTGAVVQRLIREMRRQNLPLPTIDCVDFSEEMLSQAQRRLLSLQIYPRFINADAVALPLEDGRYDTVTVAFGIRNLTEKKKALEEVFRVLKPHGNLFILELTRPPSSFIRFFHGIYMKTVVPLIGGALTFHKHPYRYLDHSIERFSLPDLLATLESCGFSCHTPVSLSCGIATLIHAEKL